MESKRCARCQEEKPLEEFGRDPRMASGRKSYCRPCSNAFAITAYYKDKERTSAVRKRRRVVRRELGLPPPPSRRQGRLRKYGLTPEEFDELLVQQGGRCAICGTTDPRGRGGFHVDHDHETGRVRGLLCHGCNVGLGHLGDRVERLQAVIAYLEAHARG